MVSSMWWIFVTDSTSSNIVGPTTRKLQRFVFSKATRISARHSSGRCPEVTGGYRLLVIMIWQVFTGMSYISYLPSSPLSTYIDDFYYIDGPAPYPRQKALPVASSNLMINLGASFDVYKPDQAEPFTTCTDSWWVGVWDTYHSVDWPSTIRFYGVHFKPGGAYPFLRFPLSDINSQVVPLDAIW